MNGFCEWDYVCWIESNSWSCSANVSQIYFFVIRNDCCESILIFFWNSFVGSFLSEFYYRLYSKSYWLIIGHLILLMRKPNRIWWGREWLLNRLCNLFSDSAMWIIRSIGGRQESFYELVENVFHLICFFFQGSSKILMSPHHSLVTPSHDNLIKRYATV